MDLGLIAILSISVMSSTYLMIGILRSSDDGLLLKIGKIVFVLIPVIGPVFYSLVIGTPKRNAFNQQDRLNGYTHMDSLGRTNFRDQWEAKKPELEANIERFRKTLDEE